MRALLPPPLRRLRAPVLIPPRAINAPGRSSHKVRVVSRHPATMCHLIAGVTRWRDGVGTTARGLFRVQLSFTTTRIKCVYLKRVLEQESWIKMKEMRRKS
jgi:hypothetical protein